MFPIFNATQHVATKEQILVGVIENPNSEVVKLLTFDSIESKEEIIDRAEKIAVIVRDSGCRKAMIGGAPYLMAPLEEALKNEGVEPLYSFTKRVTVEEPQTDGSVKKIQYFKHEGWIEV